MSRRRIQPRDESGQTAVMFIIVIPLLILMLAFAVDVPKAFTEKENLQGVADAAALAGALELGPTCASGPCAGSMASTYSANNGGPVLVACVNNNSTNCYSSPYNGQADKIEVRVRTCLSGLLGGATGGGCWGVGTRAVAKQTSGPPPAITFAALNGSGDAHTLIINSSGQLTVNSNVYINSTNSDDGFDVKGTTGTFIAPKISVVGGWERDGTAVVRVGGINCALKKATATTAPTAGCPLTGQPVTADPFAGRITAPALSGTPACSHVTPQSSALYSPDQQLSAAITTTTGTNVKTKSSGSALVQNGDYIQIDSEIMLVTAGGGSTSLTVQRAQLGTTAATHPLSSALYSANQLLNAAITTTTGTNVKTKSSGAALVQNGDYIQIDSEIMLVTAGGGTTSLTVQRAQLGTTAATHLFNPVQYSPSQLLSVAMTAAANSTNVRTKSSGAALVQNGDYIQIDSEIMLVTAGGGSTSLTVQRAQLGTTAATHQIDKPISEVTPQSISEVTPQSISEVTPATTVGTAIAPDPCVLASNTTTLQPGTYYGGICIGATDCSDPNCTASTSGPVTNVTFADGTYVMAGGGLRICGRATVSAPKVMLYNTNDPTSPTGPGALGQILLNTAGAVTLGPQPNGSHAGMTIFQDPVLAMSTAKCNKRATDLTDIVFGASSNGLSGVSGTIYAPNQDALFADSISGTTKLAVITGCIFIDGANSTFNFDTTEGGLFGVGTALDE